MYKYRDVSADTSLDAGSTLDLRRAGIVLHATAGSNSLAWLQRDEPNPTKRSSADYLVTRDGDVLQITAPGRYAFHAGRARYRGLALNPDDFNKRFIGVEVECLDQRLQEWTTQQYIATAALIRKLCVVHYLSVLNLTTHRDVALPAGRKSDPATLNEPMLTKELFYPSAEGQLIQFPGKMP